jgi:hypothetical protein
MFRFFETTRNVEENLTVAPRFRQFQRYSILHRPRKITVAPVSTIMSP